MASSGHVLPFCVCQVYIDMVRKTTTGVSFACCKWWTDAGFVALEKIYGRCKGQTRRE